MLIIIYNICESCKYANIIDNVNDLISKCEKCNKIEISTIDILRKELNNLLKIHNNTIFEDTETFVFKIKDFKLYYKDLRCDKHFKFYDISKIDKGLELYTLINMIKHNVKERI